MSQSQESSSPIKIGGISLTTTAGELREITRNLPVTPHTTLQKAVLMWFGISELSATSGCTLTGILIGAELYRRRKEEADKAEVEAMVESVKGMTAEDA